MNERLHKIKLNNDNNAKPDIPSQQKLNKLCKSRYTECKVMITKCKLDYEKTVLKLFEQLTRLK